jgi:beta-glucosidase
MFLSCNQHASTCARLPADHHSQETLAVPPPLTKYDEMIDALLSQMSDEDKIGQMTQITIDLILKDPTKHWNEIEIDPVKLARAIQI